MSVDMTLPPSPMPTDDELVAQAQQLVDAGQSPAALEILRQVLRNNPDHPLALYLYARINPDTAKAVNALNRLLNLQPAHVEARQLLRHLQQGGAPAAPAPVYAAPPVQAPAPRPAAPPAPAAPPPASIHAAPPVQAPIPSVYAAPAAQYGGTPAVPAAPPPPAPVVQPLGALVQSPAPTPAPYPAAAPSSDWQHQMQSTPAPAESYSAAPGIAPVAGGFNQGAFIFGLVTACLAIFGVAHLLNGKRTTGLLWMLLIGPIFALLMLGLVLVTNGWGAVCALPMWLVTVYQHAQDGARY